MTMPDMMMGNATIIDMMQGLLLIIMLGAIACNTYRFIYATCGPPGAWMMSCGR
jgi:hypothetical protein